MDVTQAYAINSEGDTYFNNRLESSLWFDCDENRKTVALRQATRIIDRLNFAGDKADDSQVLQFPRKNDILDQNGDVFSETKDLVVPDDIKFACFEIAYALLDGLNPDEEIKALSVQSAHLGASRTIYNRDTVPDYLRAGVPSALAWSYLMPYLRDTNELTLSRI